MSNQPQVENRVSECSNCHWQTPVNIRISLPVHGDLAAQAFDRMATTLTFECPECGETEFTIRFPPGKPSRVEICLW